MPLKYFFYQMTIPEGTTNFGASLDDAYDRRPGHEFTQQGQAYRLENYQSLAEGIRVGSVTKIAFTAGAQKGRRGTLGLQEIPFTDDEGPASPTAFLYCSTNNVVVIQSNHRGIRSGSLIRLLGDLTGVQGLDMLPVVDPTISARFNRMQIFRRVELALAGTLDPTVAERAGVKGMADISSDFDARTVRLEMGMSRGKGSMPQEIVRRLGQFLSRDIAQISTLKITGKDFDDEKNDELDLVKAALIRWIDVPQAGRIHAVDDLLRGVRQAYDEARRDGALAHVVTLEP